MRLAPFFVALKAADRLATTTQRTRARSLAHWRPGISLVIPERDAPEMLAVALQSAFDALAEIDEPHQVVVVVNGAPLAKYDALVARFPTMQIVHSASPLGFSAAIHRGLACARHDWTFLMNNDMTLERRALLQLAEHRGDDVFAIAAQIFQQSRDGRREETGFTDWYVNAQGLQLFHADPGTDDHVREHLCASGGAALFRTAPLREFVRDSRCYDPFYWEDVEWSVRAQRIGMRVLFCPGARVHHLHRATTSRFYSELEIANIVERNRVLFDARNGITEYGADWLMRRVCDLDYESQRKFATPAFAAQVFARRRFATPGLLKRPPRIADPGLAYVDLRSSYTYHLRASSPDRVARPVVLLATPFCVFPARHGGARRIQGLLNSLRKEFDVVLVTDEASLYDARSFADFDGLLAVYLVQRPSEEDSKMSTDVAARSRTHCHPTLVKAMEAARLRHVPRIVQIEYAELSPLSEGRSAAERWVLALHDAYGADDFKSALDWRQFEARLASSYDAITVCSPEDRALVDHALVVDVPNASSVDAGPYVPSTSSRLLFMGPFRYTQNFSGIRAFLADCYPAIVRSVPDVELLILGGDGARERAAGDPLFGQAGVRVEDHRDDVARLLSSCALTINPLMAIRGSSIKVIESLAAGRICVTTEDGARGFVSERLSGLVAVADIVAMTAPIIDLLLHPMRRHQAEKPDPAVFARYRWDHSAGILAKLYRSLLEPARA